MNRSETGAVGAAGVAHPELRRAEALTRLLESAVRIPGTRFRIGLDALIGLIPGIGDVAGAGLAAYIVVLASRLGAPSTLILRMLANIAIDSVIGLVPLLGDLFDIGWKANSRNLLLLTRYIERPAETRRAGRLLVLGALVGLALIVAACLALSLWALHAFFGAPA